MLRHSYVCTIIRPPTVAIRICSRLSAFLFFSFCGVRGEAGRETGQKQPEIAAASWLYKSGAEGRERWGFCPIRGRGKGPSPPGRNKSSLRGFMCALPPPPPLSPPTDHSLMFPLFWVLKVGRQPGRKEGRENKKISGEIPQKLKSAFPHTKDGGGPL